MRILVVDDEPVLREGLRRLLARAGHEVIAAGGPDTALRLLAEGPVDAVFLDRVMPKLSGEALYLVMVHRWPYLRGKVALMSGAPLDLDGGLPAELGGCHFLDKPFTVDQVIAIVQEIARQTAAESHGSA